MISLVLYAIISVTPFSHLSRVVGSTLLLGFLGRKLHVYLLRLRRNCTCVLFQSSLNTSTLLWCFMSHSPLLPIDTNPIQQNHSLSFAASLDLCFYQLGEKLSKSVVNVVLDLYWIASSLLESIVFRNCVWVCGSLRQINNITTKTKSAAWDVSRHYYCNPGQLSYLLYHYFEIYWFRMYLRKIHRPVLYVPIIYNKGRIWVS